MARDRALSVKIDTREVLSFARRLEGAIQDQLPFAQASALTDTAKKAHGAGQRSMDRAFTVRRRTLKNALAWKPAKKRDVPIEAMIHTRPWAEFLTLHTTGGVKRGKKGHRIAVPSRLVVRGASGQVKKKDRPRTLRDKKGLVEEDLARGQIRVRKRGQQGANVFHFLVRRARIKKTWRLRRVVQKEAERVFPRAYRRRLERALQTMKR